MGADPELVARVLAALGEPCDVCSAVIRIVLENPHDRQGYAKAASKQGYADRGALTRAMRRHGFPSLSRLQAVLRLLCLVDLWERHRIPLSSQVYGSGADPAVASRVVRRVTGCAWKDVRDKGTETWLPLLRILTGASGVRCGGTRARSPTR